MIRLAPQIRSVFKQAFDAPAPCWLGCTLITEAATRSLNE